MGISGLTLGGGIGVVARAYRLTSDSLESVQAVTANGAIITANAKEHADLYWACRGGGGGNFGVVTSFTFGTRPAPAPVLFFLSWPWSQAARVIRARQSWAPYAPDAMWSNMHLSAVPGGRTPTLQVGGCYLGSIGGAANLLDQLYVRAGSHPSGYFLHRNALFGAQYTTDWPYGAPAAGVARQQAWQRSFWTSMRPYAPPGRSRRPAPIPTSPAAAERDRASNQYIS